MFCRRCDDLVPAILPWKGWKQAWWVWCGVMGTMVFLFPFIASDFCVMLPSLMAMIIAGGPTYRLSREKPVCSRCSLPLDGTPGGTAIRPRADRDPSSDA